MVPGAGMGRIRMAWKKGAGQRREAGRLIGEKSQKAAYTKGPHGQWDRVGAGGAGSLSRNAKGRKSPLKKVSKIGILLRADP